MGLVLKGEAGVEDVEDALILLHGMCVLFDQMCSESRPMLQGSKCLNLYDHIMELLI